MTDEESCLQYEMHGHHTWAPTQNVLEGVGGELQEWRLLILLPRGCRHDGLAVSAIFCKHAGNIDAQGLHLAVDETACVGRDEDVVLFGFYSSYVVGRLHRSRHRVAHLDNTLRNLFQTAHERLEGLATDDCFLPFALADNATDVGVGVTIFLAQPLVHHFFLLLHKFRTLARRNGQHDFGRRGYGRVGLTNSDRSYVEVVFVIDGRKHSPRRHDSTTATLVDVDTRMSAQSAFEPS